MQVRFRCLSQIPLRCLFEEPLKIEFPNVLHFHTFAAEPSLKAEDDRRNWLDELRRA